MGRSIIALTGVALLLSACGGETVHSYKVTFAVQVDGQLHTASALQKVVTFDTADANGKATRNERSGGVAALLDLGSDGTLVMALTGDWNEWRRRKKQFGLACKEPRNLAGIVRDSGGFSDTPSLLPTTLQSWNMPVFIWFPPGRSYKDAVQMCPEEFSVVMAKDVRLVSVSYEEVPNATVPTRLDINASWLSEMRANKFASRSSRAGEAYDYWPTLPQIEGEGW